MAIINNNVQNIQFLRNKNPFESREAARTALVNNINVAEDGTSLLARYSVEESGATVIKTIVGYVAEYNSTKYLTIIDVEGGSEDVEKLREEINAKLGDGVGSGASETVTAQLTALSGNGQSTSAETSVEGAKRYADAKILELDYTGVTTGDGVYVTNVTQADGIVSATTATLPTVTDTKVAKKVVVGVSEDKGTISVERGTISSSAETMVLTGNTDGGVNFEVNIDGVSIVQDTTSKKLKVADTALTQYYGDEKTVHAEVDSTNNTKTFSTLLQISATTPSETNVKEQYNLVNASGETIGATIKIYKDSSLYRVYLGHVDDTITSATDPTVVPGTGDTALCFIYLKSDGTYELVAVNVEEFIEENEFASGVTWDSAAKKVKGVVDTQSEKDSQDTPVDFLTVGADGFKISGIKNEIDRKINALDATGGTQTIATDKHVAVEVVEANGLITAVTVVEDNIADADDLAELSAKTVTALTSTNGSITADIDDAVGCKTYDIQTDADKIQMSGFSADSTSSLSGIAVSDSIATAFEKTNDVITKNEKITAEALIDLDTRLDKVEDEYVSGITVNGTGVTVSDNVAALTLTSAPSTGAAETPIIVETSVNGGITLKFDGLDCGYYA